MRGEFGLWAAASGITGGPKRPPVPPKISPHSPDRLSSTVPPCRDNDVKYPPGFNAVLKSAGLEVPKMPVRAPNLRAHVERVIQTIQIEALDGLVVVSERHLNLINRSLEKWYNSERSHSARDYLPPGWDKPPEPNNTVLQNEIVCTTRLGGLLKSYARRAA